MHQVRGYIEQYNNPPAYNFVSICGVQNGVFACPLEIRIIPFLCDLFEADPYHFLFNGSIPLSFSDYWVVSKATLHTAHHQFQHYHCHTVQCRSTRVITGASCLTPTTTCTFVADLHEQD